MWRMSWRQRYMAERDRADYYRRLLLEVWGADTTKGRSQGVGIFRRDPDPHSSWEGS